MLPARLWYLCVDESAIPPDPPHSVSLQCRWPNWENNSLFVSVSHPEMVAPTGQATIASSFDTWLVAMKYDAGKYTEAVRRFILPDTGYYSIKRPPVHSQTVGVVGGINEYPLRSHTNRTPS